ncbi:hypothetical protein Q75_07295 [Bacillus coahuilensis p1.1.43]|uniref:Small, acid-soluble spore protein N n=1 Tax=Bacillus coahuilensis p1.1.43 TaxID=1150625 RepID=A0A147K8V7_9BACI|nr:hypothetical protein [Bacillus coahuilensis]KUP06753.1 hypothetical protein Q75_07295 [Bacillus coahuilensis p1.1.43]
MPYHKDKQQAFQSAQQGYTEAVNAHNELVIDASNYGHQLSHLQNEVLEAYQQIENALEVASEHQRSQLERFQNDLGQIMSQMNE